MYVPTLETERLAIRPLALQDLDSCHQLYTDIGWTKPDYSESRNREEQRAWLQWSVMNYEQLARLHQPPFGERAVTLKEDGRFAGLVGYVPYLNAFGQLPYFGGAAGAGYTLEMGLFWAISPAHQGQGYATEAAQALIDYAFTTFRLKRIVAGTDYDNLASQGVMRRLGMRLERNPFPEPPWLQVVGILERGRDFNARTQRR
ncbi:MAG: GNAT family N-acetyltransferase [Chloroflexi bacterium]|nr:GNAT family N-acetyltransferase [Chloroflexota bacterium]MCI0580829.1 GNAT family N-acetyltransferase [Chloroflexota bacterium]MCI0648177.1 GNAT family N-acetyltransferase [Chloroflexota bacterium]MCI0730319.1 GNAT family N-acetyltransferase [Chloroflexota bacterium]